MKLNRIIYIITIIIITNACSSKKEKLYGLWVGSYAIDSEIGEKKGIDRLPLYEIIEFDENNVYKRSFNYSKVGLQDTLEIFDYTLNDSQLIYASDTFQILKVDEDSLKLRRTVSKYSSELSYSKLAYKDCLKNIDSIDLDNGIYSLSSKHLVDTFMISKSGVLVDFNKESINDRTFSQWYITSYKQFYFFIIEDFAHVPYLIIDVKEDTLLLKNFYENFDHGGFKLIKISSLDSTESVPHSLKYKWSEFPTSTSDNPFFYEFSDKLRYGEKGNISEIDYCVNELNSAMIIGMSLTDGFVNGIENVEVWDFLIDNDTLKISKDGHTFNNLFIRSSDSQGIEP